MILTRSSEYAVDLVLFLVSQKRKKYVPLIQVSEQTGLSFHYLSKIAGQLTRKGLLKSYRGPRGGVTLTKEEGQITLHDIVEAIEGDALLNKCVLRPQPCNGEDACPVHDQWLPIRDRIRHLFVETSVDAFKESEHRRKGPTSV